MEGGISALSTLVFAFMFVFVSWSLVQWKGVDFDAKEQLLAQPSCVFAPESTSLVSSHTSTSRRPPSSTARFQVDEVLRRLLLPTQIRCILLFTIVIILNLYAHNFCTVLFEAEVWITAVFCCGVSSHRPHIDHMSTTRRQHVDYVDLTSTTCRPRLGVQVDVHRPQFFLSNIRPSCKF
jgi:hypothetical protein